MPNLRDNGYRPGHNTEALEQTVAELEAEGRLATVDRPLLAHARTLAAACDSNPADSQLAMQYGMALNRLREDVTRSDARDFHELLRALAECQRDDGPYGWMHTGDQVWCQGCVVEYIVWTLGHVELAEKVGRIQAGVLAGKERQAPVA